MPVALPIRLRRPLVVATALATAGTTLALLPTGAAQAASATTVQVSVTTGGFAPGNGANNAGGSFERRQVSADGRYVVFASSGPVLQGQTQLRWQIIRRDRQLGTSTLISKSSAGVEGNGFSSAPSISADGQVIAFHSHASNLVPGDTNGTSDIFVHDVRTGRTTRVSVTGTGAQVPTGQVAGSNVVGPPSISADGRWVGFTSRVRGYTADDSTDTEAYLHDRRTGAIEVVSRHADGTVASAHPDTAVSPSADGLLVAFQSLENLTVGAGNDAIDVWLRDRTPGAETTTLVGGDAHRDLRHSLSANGRFVVFDSDNDTLGVAEPDTNGKDDVFVFDRQAPPGSQMTRVSVSSAGAQGNGNSTHAAISADGRYVTFQTAATNLVAGDTNGVSDVLRHDRHTGQTIRVSVGAGGGQNPAASTAASISGDGRQVSFESYGSTLTGVDTRGYGQVFVRDLVGRYPALHARLGALPSRVWPDRTHRVGTIDIRTGPALALTWTPTGATGGGVVRQQATVRDHSFVLRSPRRPGSYQLTVSYAGNTLATRSVTVRKPTAKKLPKKAKKGKRLVIRTVGLDRGQRVRVRFNPRGATRGKAVTRSGKVNAKGRVSVKAPPRRGRYQVVVRAKGDLLRKGVVRLR